jgi:glyoxylase-like metal-dependent hydrolase (beta-lactamase superfamily II)
MNDEPAGVATPRGPLTYPMVSLPLTGQTFEIAPGVHWLRMPLPFGLNHINLWVLEDGPGWTVVDTGMQTPEIAAAWQSTLSGALGSRPVRRVICTHMHPDHMGMAGWLTRRFNCPLWASRLEYLTCRVLVADTGREAPVDAIRFYRAAGWDADALEHYRTRFGGFGKMVYTLPDSYRRIVDGEEIFIGGTIWKVVVGRGHSPEHVCLYCPERGLLISGDQVLPKITSNVSVFPTEPDADPLTEWLESLASIQLRVPNEVLVLPSHNEPFYGLHARLRQLTQGHERNLERLSEELADRKRAIDIFGILFRRTVHGDHLTMATGESLAHLNCLVRRGKVVRQIDASGVAWYERRASTDLTSG